MKLYGVIPPMVTPFKESGDVDYNALEVLVRFLATNVDGLFVCGSYGSGPLMNMDERKEVATKSIEFAAGKVPVIVHTGSASSREAAQLSAHAVSIGALAVSAVAPYYFHHSPKGIIEYYRSILAAVPKGYPVYVYHNPRFSGYEIDMETMVKLADMGIAGVKDATFDIAKFSAYRRDLSPRGFDVVLGTESMWLSARVLGAEAFIPGLANAFPELCTELHRQGMQNDYEKACKTQFVVNKIRDLMYLAGSTQQAVYAMLSIRGIVKSYPRSPFLAANQSAQKELQELLAELGVL
jgi:dihydrodipicolinate synthase/N-acetylneuraminate lyase